MVFLSKNLDADETLNDLLLVVPIYGESQWERVKEYIRIYYESASNEELFKSSEGRLNRFVIYSIFARGFRTSGGGIKMHDLFACLIKFPMRAN